LFLNGLSTEARYSAAGITKSAVSRSRLTTGMLNRLDCIKNMCNGDVFLSRIEVQTEKAIATENLRKK
jgi:hypothetical protein